MKLVIFYILSFARMGEFPSTGGVEKTRKYETFNGLFQYVGKLINKALDEVSLDVNLTKEGFALVNQDYYQILTKCLPQLLNTNTAVNTQFLEYVQTAKSNLNSVLTSMGKSKDCDERGAVYALLEWIELWTQYCLTLEDEMTLCIEVDAKSIQFNSVL